MEPSNDLAKNYENQGSDYLDDVAWYMHRNDMKANYPGSKVSVYTVGFGLGGQMRELSNCSMRLPGTALTLTWIP